MVSKKLFSSVLATLVILSILGSTVAFAQTATVTAQKTIVQTAEGTPTLSDLWLFLSVANLTPTLNDTTKNYTVFAPDNAAFDKLGNTTLAALANDTPRLATILKSHVIVGQVNLTTNGSAQTLAGNTITWTANGTKVQLVGGSNATVTTANITTSNGVVNVIDTVLVPPAGATTTGAANVSATAGGGFLGLPGFEALYAVAGLLAVAYLVMRRKQ